VLFREDVPCPRHQKKQAAKLVTILYLTLILSAF
jgi:hypothetical protein